MKAGWMLLPALAATMAGCVSQETGESLRILRSDGEQVVLRGLLDATRTAPPPRYDALAATECARFGKTAVFAQMAQQSTFGFDVTYRCMAETRAP